VTAPQTGRVNGTEAGPAALPAPEGPAPLLAAYDITMRFGGLLALDRVSIDVPPRSFAGLVGPNGAGKSTLFAVLSGLLRPDAGRVLFDGTDITRETAQARALRGLGRTFQHPEVFFTLTVREHLVLAYRARHSRRRVLTDMLLAPSRWRRDPAEDARVDALVDSLGLGPAAHRRAAGLPLGLMRRLEVARALAGEPRLLMLDEPSSGLDIRETEQLADALRAAAEAEGLAVLMVEHDLDLVLGLSQHMFVLDFGKLIADGTPDQVRRSSVVQAAYLGTDDDPGRDDHPGRGADGRP
jgi:ABC-type branched-subunit amino acid transport system ATPase component